jgi:hypothetical protein
MGVDYTARASDEFGLHCKKRTVFDPDHEPRTYLM